MSTSPAKHKSNHHHHHHHHHREHHHPSSAGGTSAGYSSTSIPKTTPNLTSLIKIQDNSKLLPRYSLALSKPHDEYLPMDELDAIQMELECLLSSVALRYRALKVEYDFLEDRKHQKKKDADKEKANSPSVGGGGGGGSGKRKRDDKKSSSSSSKESSRYSHTKHSKVKSSGSSNSPAHHHHQQQQQQQSHIDHTTNSSTNDHLPYSNLNVSTHSQHTNHHNKLLLPKNDVPQSKSTLVPVNKFWLSVEPYCMPITNEDIKLLDELIDDYTEPLVPAIPELGPHYAVRWASEDLRDDTPKTSSTKKATTPTTATTSTTTTGATTTNASAAATAAHEKNMGQGICGPLTQHLISALLDDNTNEFAQNDIGAGGCSDATMIQDSNDSCTENNSSSANRTKAGSTTTAANTAAVAIESLWKSGIDVEKRLKKELLDLGIFEASDFAKDKDDEVLNEIKRVRTELQAIAEYNRDELKLLRAAAKEEMKRLEVKRKLDRIDQEIIEAYKRVFEAKQKRRPLSKHERNEIFRLADEQKKLSDQLEAMPIPGFNYAVGKTTTTTTPAATKITATTAVGTASATAVTNSTTITTAAAAAATSASNISKA